MTEALSFDVRFTTEELARLFVKQVCAHKGTSKHGVALYRDADVVRVFAPDAYMKSEILSIVHEFGGAQC